MKKPFGKYGRQVGETFYKTMCRCQSLVDGLERPSFAFIVTNYMDEETNHRIRVLINNTRIVLKQARALYQDWQEPEEDECSE